MVQNPIPFILLKYTLHDQQIVNTVYLYGDFLFFNPYSYEQLLKSFLSALFSKPNNSLMC